MQTGSKRREAAGGKIPVLGHLIVEQREEHYDYLSPALAVLLLEIVKLTKSVVLNRVLVQKVDD